MVLHINPQQMCVAVPQETCSTPKTHTMLRVKPILLKAEGLTDNYSHYCQVVTISNGKNVRMTYLMNYKHSHRG